MNTGFRVSQGLATLGPQLLRARTLLDSQFLAWAGGCSAADMVFPPLLGVSDLAAFDFFHSFPHLALMAAPLRLDGPAPDGGTVPAAALAGSTHALPSAACYGVYLDLRGTRLEAPRRVTTVAQCFRKEERFEGLRRLCAFTMREIVCVGDAAAVKDHLTLLKAMIADFAGTLGLELDLRPASDPFFAPESGRAVMQKLFPVKEEFVHDGSLAIASVNFHRNFFGERCDITQPEGEAAYSGCVAFGLERWLAALLDVAGGDPDEVLALVEKCLR